MKKIQFGSRAKIIVGAESVHVNDGDADTLYGVVSKAKTAAIAPDNPD